MRIVVVENMELSGITFNSPRGNSRHVVWDFVIDTYSVVCDPQTSTVTLYLN